MGSIFQRYRQFILISLLLIYALAQILSIGKQQQQQLNWLEKTIVIVTSPPQQFLTYCIDRINHLRLSYLYLVDTRKNYLDLLEQHRQVVLRVNKLEESERENSRLRSLLGFKEDVKLEMQAARVISLGTSTFTHSLRINKGSNVGIQQGMSVVTSEGVVGHILDTTGHYADVLLITDPKSNVDIVDQETRSRGIIQGRGGEKLGLEFVSRSEPVEIDHHLVTSGLDGIYPKGLPVGTIVSKKSDPSNIFVEAEVRPAVTIAKLEEVLVITSRLRTDETSADHNLERNSERKKK